MNWKEFLKPNFKKILVVLLVFFITFIFFVSLIPTNLIGKNIQSMAILIVFAIISFFLSYILACFYLIIAGFITKKIPLFKLTKTKAVAGLTVFLISTFVLTIPIYTISSHSVIEYTFSYTACPILFVGTAWEYYYGEETIAYSFVWYISFVLAILYWYGWGCVLVYFYNKLKVVDKKI